MRKLGYAAGADRRPLRRRHQGRHRPRRRDRRRRGPALRAEPARLALPRPRPGGGLERVPRAPRARRDRRRVRPRALPLQPRERGPGRLREEPRRRCARRSTPPSAIDADGVVFHVGSHLGAGSRPASSACVPRSSRRSSTARTTTWLLIENSAGAGGTIGRSIEELAAIVDRLDRHPRLGVCLDSCHLYASGVRRHRPRELDRLLEEVDATIGLDRLRALHVNDSKAPLGSNRDRHATCSRASGRAARRLPRPPALQGLPAVIETGRRRPTAPRPPTSQTLRELHARWRRDGS